VSPGTLVYNVTCTVIFSTNQGTCDGRQMPLYMARKFFVVIDGPSLGIKINENLKYDR